jgi:hypothetical protein
MIAGVPDITEREITQDMAIQDINYEIVSPNEYIKFYCYLHARIIIPGDQEGLFKLAVQLRNFFNSVIYNTATGYVLLVYLTNI